MGSDAGGAEETAVSGKRKMAISLVLDVACAAISLALSLKSHRCLHEGMAEIAGAKLRCLF